MRQAIFFGYMFILIGFTSVTPHRVFSQETNNFRQKKKVLSDIFNTYDSTFVKKTDAKFVVGIKNHNWLDVYKLNSNNIDVNFKSDLYYDLGLFMGYKFLQVAYYINMNNLLSGEKAKRKGLNLDLVSNIVSLECFYFKNEGKTNIAEYSLNDINQVVDIPFYGLQSKIFGADFYYYFNNKRYSNSAAYADGHYYTQNKNAGSFIAGISFSNNNISYDFSEFKNDEDLSALSEIGPIKNNYYTYCVSVGYGYNFVFSKNWLANLTVIPSLGTKVKKDDNSHKKYFTTRNKSKIAVIYSLPKYFFGINCQYNINWDNSGDYVSANSMGTFNLLLGVRF